MRAGSLLMQMTHLQDHVWNNVSHTSMWPSASQTVRSAQNKPESVCWSPLLLGVSLRVLMGGSYDLMAKNMTASGLAQLMLCSH